MGQHQDPLSSPPPEDHGSADLPLIDLEAINHHPFFGRKRLLQIGLLLGVFTVVLATLWHVLFMASLPPAPQPQPPLLPTTAVISSNVNYGTVRMNGKDQPAAPPLVVTVRSDTADITVTASPFKPRTCHFRHLGWIDPSSSSGGCVALYAPDPTQLTIHGVSSSPSLRLWILFSGDDLPPDQRAAARAVLTPQALGVQQSITVPAGSYIPMRVAQDGTITSQLTTIALQASATFTPETADLNPNLPDSCEQLRCAPFLTDPQLMAALPHPGWDAVVTLVLRWRFTTAGGQVVSEITLPAGTREEVFLSSSVSSGWLLMQPQPHGFDLTKILQYGFLAIGESLLQARLQAQFPSDPHLEAHIPQRNAEVQGCELAPTRSGSGLGLFLWRFGVLLAADDQAHTTLPTLPVAPPEEIAAIEG